jgi:hypothetical protein
MLFWFEHQTQGTNHKESFDCPTIEGEADAFTIRSCITTLNT